LNPFYISELKNAMHCGVSEQGKAQAETKRRRRPRPKIIVDPLAGVDNSSAVIPSGISLQSSVAVLLSLQLQLQASVAQEVSHNCGYGGRGL